VQNPTVLPLLKDCAAQILLFLHQGVGSPPVFRFSKLEPACELSKKLALLDQNDDFPLRTVHFCKIAESVLNRRNLVTCFTTLEELDVGVVKATQAFHAWPAMILRCKEDYDIISNYDAIKLLF
jgi:hypothetical protein